MPFTCSICGEESSRICARCTKDSCDNHLCDKCRRCSDCCECEVRLAEPAFEPMRHVVRVTTPDDENETLVFDGEDSVGEEEPPQPEVQQEPQPEVQQEPQPEPEPEA